MPIIRTYYKVHRVFPDPDYVWLENTSENQATFTVTTFGSPSGTLEYSLDKSTWTDIHSGGNVNVPSGEKVYLRSSNGLGSTNTAYVKLNMDQNHKAGGHVSSLVNYNNIESTTTIPDYAFRMLFDGDSHLVETNLDFSGITELGSGSCMAMFQNCTALRSNYCDMSDITTLNYLSCNSMFTGSAITEVQSIPNITAIPQSAFYNMYSSCSNILSGMDLSNITSTGAECCVNMYKWCANLNYAVAPNISNWNTYQFASWLHGTAATGVVRKPAGLTITTDSTSGVPTGWTTENY